MSLIRLPIKIYWYGFFLLVGIGAAFYLLIGSGAKASVTEQLLTRQRLIAKAEASNFESFFQVFGESISVISQLKTITSQNSAIWDLNVFVEEWRNSGIVDGIVLTNANGIVRFNSNVAGATGGVGISLADRDYFNWAKNEAKPGDYFVGDPVISRLGASKDQPIVPVASPVYENGTFAGVVVAAVRLKNLNHEFLELMKVSGSTDIFLINENSDLLFSNNYSGGVGSSVFDLMKSNPFPGSDRLTDRFREALDKGGEGEMKASYLDPRSGKVEPHVMAYVPIDLGSQKWILLMASPAQDLWNLDIPMYVRLIVFVLLLGLTIYIFGIVTVREDRSRRG